MTLAQLSVNKCGSASHATDHRRGEQAAAMLPGKLGLVRRIDGACDVDHIPWVCPDQRA